MNCTQEGPTTFLHRFATALTPSNEVTKFKGVLYAILTPNEVAKAVFLLHHEAHVRVILTFPAHTAVLSTDLLFTATALS